MQMEEKYGRPFQTLIDAPPPTVRLLNTSCFKRGARGMTKETFFGEIANIAGTDPACGGCRKPLPRKGKASWYDQSKKLASFWLIRCPECKAPHIIFNRIDDYVVIANSLYPDPPPAVGNGRSEKQESVNQTKLL